MLNSATVIAILCVSLVISALALGLLIGCAVQLKQKRRAYGTRKMSGIAAVIAAILVSLAAWLCITQAPRVIAWENVAPGLMTAASWALELMVILICAWFLSDVFYPREKESYVSLVVLGIISGFGNFLVISIINAGLNNLEGNALPLAVYFVFGIITYLSCQKLLRTRFIYLANGIVYAKRKSLTEKILGASYETFEGIDTGKIFAGLNNDTETVSEAANLMILAVTAALTVTFCFIYLALVNLWGLLIALGVILAAMAVYFVVGQKARRIWNQTRDIQNIFFKFISDMVGGFKELAVHKEKRAEFTEDMLDKCGQYRDKKIEASVRLTNVFVLGELMFTATIGAVTFLFSLLFDGIPVSTTRSFVVIFLYMSSPVYTLLNTIPNLIQVKISWERILGLERSLSQMPDSGGKAPRAEDGAARPEAYALEVRDVSYTYKNDQSGAFRVGPLSCRFAPGEICFITGGNGSGKSTLAKLMTGLYPADAGEVLVGGQAAAPDQLGQYFSVIFSDSYLFDRLYGINCRGKEAFINEQLRILRLDDKLSVENGTFSHTSLSTGQRKRMALLVSYLEDRPIYLFDEWAADQDPVFRKFFYQDLIFRLKASGKCVIAITHDDHYFHLADKVVKMEMGQITEITEGEQMSTKNHDSEVLTAPEEKADAAANEAVIEEETEEKAIEKANTKPAKKKPGRKGVKRLLRILKIAGVCLLALIVLAAGFLYWFVRRPWPQTNGNLAVSGLRAEVTVSRDSYGVPNIYAQNDHDLLFAQGYVTAQDRLFQMEMHRRLGTGTLSEVAGGAGVWNDRVSRTYGFRRIAEACYPNFDEETKSLLEAYCEGINAYIDTHKNTLPLEFTLMGFSPPHWDPIDVVSFANFMAQINALNMNHELYYAQTYAKLGETMTADELPPYDPDNPVIITKELEPYSWGQLLSPDTTPRDIPALIKDNFASGHNEWLKYADLSALTSEDALLPSLQEFGWGSGTWAVSGQYTDTGKPILACDVHMSIYIPSFWYEIGLHGGSFDVSGCSLPGAPFVFLGRNRDISWGFVNLNSDVIDLYTETLDSTAYPTKYLFQGQWYDLERKTEVINIKGADPLVLDLMFTRHGPIITDALQLHKAAGDRQSQMQSAARGDWYLFNWTKYEAAEPISMRWSVQDGCYVTEAMAMMNRAGNWEEFRAALSKWDSLGESFIYADNQGNIGYQAATKIPIRADKHLGVVPVSGSSGEYEWQGYIPFEELPSLYNPPTGYVASVNTKTTTDDYPYLITYDWWHPGYRARTVVTELDKMIASGKKITVEDMRALQCDTYSYAADQINAYFKDVVPDDELQAEALEHVKSWDGRFELDSVGAAIYQVWYLYLDTDTFEDEKRAYDIWGFQFPLKHIESLVDILKEPDNQWFDNVLTQGTTETRDDIVKWSFTQAIDYLKKNYGNDPSKWTLDRIQTVTLKHPLFGDMDFVGPLYYSREIPFAGSPTSVAFAYSNQFPPHSPLNITFGSTQKHIMSFDDPDNMQEVISSGQSMHLYNPRREDQMELWASGQLHPMPFTRDAVNAAAKDILILEPKA